VKKIPSMQSQTKLLKHTNINLYGAAYNRQYLVAKEKQKLLIQPHSNSGSMVMEVDMRTPSVLHLPIRRTLVASLLWLTKLIHFAFVAFTLQ